MCVYADALVYDMHRKENIYLNIMKYMALTSNNINIKLSFNACHYFEYSADAACWNCIENEPHIFDVPRLKARMLAAAFVRH